MEIKITIDDEGSFNMNIDQTTSPILIVGTLEYAKNVVMDKIKNANIIENAVGEGSDNE